MPKELFTAAEAQARALALNPDVGTRTQNLQSKSQEKLNSLAGKQIAQNTIESSRDFEDAILQSVTDGDGFTTVNGGGEYRLAGDPTKPGNPEGWVDAKEVAHIGRDGKQWNGDKNHNSRITRQATMMGLDVANTPFDQLEQQVYKQGELDKLDTLYTALGRPKNPDGTEWTPGPIEYDVQNDPLILGDRNNPLNVPVRVGTSAGESHGRNLRYLQSEDGTQDATVQQALRGNTFVNFENGKYKVNNNNTQNNFNPLSEEDIADMLKDDNDGVVSAIDPINLAKAAAADIGGFALDTIDSGMDAVGKGVQKLQAAFGHEVTNDDLKSIGSALGYTVDPDGQLRHYYDYQDRQGKDKNDGKGISSTQAFDNFLGTDRTVSNKATEDFQKESVALWNDDSKSIMQKVTGTVKNMYKYKEALPMGMVDSIAFMATMGNPAGIMANIANNANGVLEKRLAEGDPITTTEGYVANVALATVSTLAEFAGDKLAFGLKGTKFGSSFNAKMADKLFSGIPDSMKDKFAAKLLTSTAKAATKAIAAGAEEFTTEGFQKATELVQERLEKNGYNLDNAYKLMDKKSKDMILGNALTGMQLGIGQHAAGSAYNAVTSTAANNLKDKIEALAKDKADKEAPTGKEDIADKEVITKLHDEFTSHIAKGKEEGNDLLATVASAKKAFDTIDIGLDKEDAEAVKTQADRREQLVELAKRAREQLDKENGGARILGASEADRKSIFDMMVEVEENPAESIESADDNQKGLIAVAKKLKLSDYQIDNALRKHSGYRKLANGDTEDNSISTIKHDLQVVANGSKKQAKAAKARLEKTAGGLNTELSTVESGIKKMADAEEEHVMQTRGGLSASDRRAELIDSIRPENNGGVWGKTGVTIEHNGKTYDIADYLRNTKAGDKTIKKEKGTLYYDKAKTYTKLDAIEAVDVSEDIRLSGVDAHIGKKLAKVEGQIKDITTKMDEVNDKESLQYTELKLKRDVMYAKKAKLNGSGSKERYKAVKEELEAAKSKMAKLIAKKPEKDKTSGKDKKTGKKAYKKDYSKSNMIEKTKKEITALEKRLKKLDTRTEQDKINAEISKKMANNKELIALHNGLVEKNEEFKGAAAKANASVEADSEHILKLAEEYYNGIDALQKLSPDTDIESVISLQPDISPETVDMNSILKDMLAELTDVNLEVDLGIPEAEIELLKSGVENIKTDADIEAATTVLESGIKQALGMLEEKPGVLDESAEKLAELKTKYGKELKESKRSVEKLRLIKYDHDKIWSDIVPEKGTEGRRDAMDEARELQDELLNKEGFISIEFLDEAIKEADKAQKALLNEGKTKEASQDLLTNLLGAIAERSESMRVDGVTKYFATVDKLLKVSNGYGSSLLGLDLSKDKALEDLAKTDTELLRKIIGLGADGDVDKNKLLDGKASKGGNTGKNTVAFTTDLGMQLLIEPTENQKYAFEKNGKLPTAEVKQAKSGVLNKNVVLIIRSVIENHIKQNGSTMIQKSREEVEKMLAPIYNNWEGLDPKKKSALIKEYQDKSLLKNVNSSLGRDIARALGIEINNDVAYETQKAAFEATLGFKGVQLGQALGYFKISDIANEKLGHPKGATTAFISIVGNDSRSKRASLDKGAGLRDQIGLFTDAFVENKTYSTTPPKVSKTAAAIKNSSLKDHQVSEIQSAADEVTWTTEYNLDTVTMDRLLELEDEDPDGFQEKLMEIVDTSVMDITDDATDSIESKNRANQLAWDNLKIMYLDMQKGNIPNRLWFKTFNPVSNRTHFVANEIDPQTVKLHRFIIRPKGQITMINRKTDSGSNKYKAVAKAVAWNLGMGIDKTHPFESEAIGDALLNMTAEQIKEIEKEVLENGKYEYKLGDIITAKGKETLAKEIDKHNSLLAKARKAAKKDPEAGKYTIADDLVLEKVLGAKQKFEIEESVTNFLSATTELQRIAGNNVFSNKFRVEIDGTTNGNAHKAFQQMFVDMYTSRHGEQDHTKDNMMKAGITVYPDGVTEDNNVLFVLRGVNSISKMKMLGVLDMYKTLAKKIDPKAPKWAAVSDKVNTLYSVLNGEKKDGGLGIVIDEDKARTMAKPSVMQTGYAAMVGTVKKTLGFDMITGVSQSGPIHGVNIPNELYKVSKEIVRRMKKKEMGADQLMEMVKENPLLELLVKSNGSYIGNADAKGREAGVIAAIKMVTEEFNKTGAGKGYSFSEVTMDSLGINPNGIAAQTYLVNQAEVGPTTTMGKKLHGKTTLENLMASMFSDAYAEPLVDSLYENFGAVFEGNRVIKNSVMAMGAVYIAAVKDQIAKMKDIHGGQLTITQANEVVAALKKRGISPELMGPGQKTGSYGTNGATINGISRKTVAEADSGKNGVSVNALNGDKTKGLSILETEFDMDVSAAIVMLTQSTDGTNMSQVISNKGMDALLNIFDAILGNAANMEASAKAMNEAFMQTGIEYNMVEESAMALQKMLANTPKKYHDAAGKILDSLPDFRKPTDRIATAAEVNANEKGIVGEVMGLEEIFDEMVKYAHENTKLKKEHLEGHMVEVSQFAFSDNSVAVKLINKGDIGTYGNDLVESYYKINSVDDIDITSDVSKVVTATHREKLNMLIEKEVEEAIDKVKAVLPKDTKINDEDKLNNWITGVVKAKYSDYNMSGTLDENNEYVSNYNPEKIYKAKTNVNVEGNKDKFGNLTKEQFNPIADIAKEILDEGQFGMAPQIYLNEYINEDGKIDEMGASLYQLMLQYASKPLKTVEC